jgi:hypothetical protein
MPISDLKPESMEDIAEQMEDSAYALPPSQERTEMLIEVYKLRRAANRAKLEEEFVICAEVCGAPPGGLKNRPGNA